MYGRDAHVFCFLTQTGGVGSGLWTVIRDWTPTGTPGDAQEGTCIMESKMVYRNLCAALETLK